MKEVISPYFDPEFDSLIERIQGPSCRACIDNESCETCTVVKVDSVNKQGLLLEVVQVLTDLELYICKGYISSDAGWFMDVFHVRDQQGNKLRDENLLNYIQQTIGSKTDSISPKKVKSPRPRPTEAGAATAIEMTATYRPGLFSEISAVLAELRCNIIEAHAWSHNECLACIIHISDETTCRCIEDPSRLTTIKGHLSTVLKGAGGGGGVEEDGSGVMMGFPGCGGPITHKERRLHQLMLAGHDFEGQGEEERRTLVSIESCNEKEYSVVNVESKNRRKLLFDTVCTLTDMQYVVFHASIASKGSYASQEFYIRHMDGCTLNTEGKKERVVKCLEAAIERRVCEGVRLEFCTRDRVGLLSDITRLLREHGLSVVRADVMTKGEEALSIFYVRDISGNAADMELVECMRREMEPLALHVTNETLETLGAPDNSWQSLGDLLKSQLDRISTNFISIK